MPRQAMQCVAWGVGAAVAMSCLAPIPRAAAAAPQPAAAAAEAAEAPKPEAADDAPRIQMAILLDTSGSMSGLINQARAQLWKIVNEFAAARRDGKSPRLEVALYEYGNSGLNAETGWVRRIVPLTDDLDKISQELFALTTNGGDEYCGQVIEAAIRELAWSGEERDVKCIFIAGNEPFTQGPVDFRKACQSAIDKGVTVSTIFCGPEAEGVQTQWQEGALVADGSFVSIDQNQAVAEIPTPHDKKLAELSGKLNATYVVFGDVKQREMLARNQFAQDANAAGVSSATAATRAYFKASNNYVCHQWDLVDACRLNKVKLEDLKDEALPEELRKLTFAQRKAYIEKQTKSRAKLQAEIKELAATRQKYLAKALEEQQTGAEGQGLDRAVILSVRKQAEKKQFHFAE
ncbi:MAG: VWA domain-containing protein [Planctomycetes bacterium]|nr:VWA domain-containing protein [Planctomycetota bacterium]